MFAAGMVSVMILGCGWGCSGGCGVALALGVAGWGMLCDGLVVRGRAGGMLLVALVLGLVRAWWDGVRKSGISLDILFYSETSGV